jgi:Domain of unknown function (DUF4386)
MSATTTGDSAGLRRVTGWLFVVGAVAFAVAATVLSSTFEWPDILREPPEVVLPAFVDGGTSLVWTWFAVAWTYAILLVPILLLPSALGRREDPVLRAATFVGAASVLLSLIGFLRWVFVVPPWPRPTSPATLPPRRRSPPPGRAWPPARCTCSTRATSSRPPSPGSPSGTSAASSAAPSGAPG